MIKTPKATADLASGRGPWQWIVSWNHIPHPIFSPHAQSDQAKIQENKEYNLIFKQHPFNQHKIIEIKYECRKNQRQYRAQIDIWFWEIAARKQQRESEKDAPHQQMQGDIVNGAIFYKWTHFRY